MITDETIVRINFLAKKAKTEGLTVVEAEEQKVLRKAFLENIKSQVKTQLESIEFVDDVVGPCSCGCGHDHEHKHEHGHKHHHGHKHEHGHDHGHHCGCGCDHENRHK